MSNDQIDLDDPAVVRVLWAAMCAMVKDLYAPQDMLTDADWRQAERVFQVLDRRMNDE